jgi:prepilin-type N-terminal cleavage/methylation domain-containing protein
MSSRATIRAKAGGFTIVEVMIVLAIAGLILLIVFEAIPALQRSSRNNQRKQDVQTILSAVSHYELNDSGNFPADCGGAVAHACTETLGTSNDYFLRYVAPRLTYYTDASTTDPEQVVLKGQAATTFADQAAVTNSETVFVYNYEKCKSDGSATWQGAGHNDVVALYATEAGSGTTSLCQQL